MPDIKPKGLVGAPVRRPISAIGSANKDGTPNKSLPADGRITSDYQKPLEKYDYRQHNILKWLIIISYLRAYPYRVLYYMRSKDAEIDVTLLQRVYLLAASDYQRTFITGARGSTKTHCAVGSQLVEGVLYPGMMSKHIAPDKRQAADILDKTFLTYNRNYKFLMLHWYLEKSQLDTVYTETRFGSHIQSHATLSSNRGDNLTRVVAEECGQEDKWARAFNHETFRSAIRPAVRVGRRIKGVTDALHVPNKELYITSATSQQNDAFTYRKNIIEAMQEFNHIAPPNRVGTGMALGNNWVAPVACNMRDIYWVKTQHDELMPEEWLREMEGVWTGVIENPMVPDIALSNARILKHAEFKHCNKPKTLYCIGIDTSMSNADGNAKCAVAVLKGTEILRDGTLRLLRELVNVFDFIPPSSDREQAVRYKRILNDYMATDSAANTAPMFGYPLICIDAKNNGRNIVAELMRDIGDGMYPLKCVNGWLPELELEDSVAAILPILPQSIVKDQDYITLSTANTVIGDISMINDIRREFANRNIYMLIQDIAQGVNEYNRKNHIRDSVTYDNEQGALVSDSEAAVPYIKTRELVGQIRNLKMVEGKETRVSQRTNRDMWSALKYANRGMTIIEKQLYRPRKSSQEIPDKKSSMQRGRRSHGGFSRLVTKNHGGVKF